jgi:hypothetical protein
MLPCHLACTSDTLSARTPPGAKGRVTEAVKELGIQHHAMTRSTESTDNQSAFLHIASLGAKQKVKVPNEPIALGDMINFVIHLIGHRDYVLVALV